MASPVVSQSREVDDSDFGHRMPFLGRPARQVGTDSLYTVGSTWRCSDV